MAFSALGFMASKKATGNIISALSQDADSNLKTQSIE
jgi:hypothetical protein